jgi:hypothetical protein
MKTQDCKTAMTEIAPPASVPTHIAKHGPVQLTAREMEAVAAAGGAAGGIGGERRPRDGR